MGNRHPRQDGLLRQLGSDEFSFCHMKLKAIDSLLHGCKDDMILEIYIVWLHENFLSDTAPLANREKSGKRSALFQSWCARLKNFKFDHQSVFHRLRNWNNVQLRRTITDRNYIEGVEAELELVWSRLRGKAYNRRDLDRPCADDNNPSRLRYTASPSDNRPYNANDRNARMRRNSKDNNSIDTSFLHDNGDSLEGETNAHSIPKRKSDAKQSKRDFATTDPDQEDSVMSYIYSEFLIEDSRPPFLRPTHTTKGPPDDYICYRCERPGEAPIIVL